MPKIKYSCVRLRNLSNNSFANAWIIINATITLFPRNKKVYDQPVGKKLRKINYILSCTVTNTKNFYTHSMWSSKYPITRYIT